MQYIQFARAAFLPKPTVADKTILSLSLWLYDKKKVTVCNTFEEDWKRYMADCTVKLTLTEFCSFKTTCSGYYASESMRKQVAQPWDRATVRIEYWDSRAGHSFIAYVKLMPTDQVVFPYENEHRGMRKRIGRALISSDSETHDVTEKMRQLCGPFAKLPGTFTYRQLMMELDHLPKKEWKKINVYSSLGKDLYTLNVEEGLQKNYFCN